jgi:hypothetical protein
MFAIARTMGGDIGSVDMDPHLRHRGVANWNKSEPNDAPKQWLLIRFPQSIGPFVRGMLQSE